MEKNLLKKGIISGFIAFVITQALSFVYPILLMSIFPSGTPRNPTIGLLFLTSTLVRWLCRPLSALIISLKINIPNPLIVLRIVDLIFWIGIFLLFLSYKNKSSK